MKREERYDVLGEEFKKGLHLTSGMTVNWGHLAQISQAMSMIEDSQDSDFQARMEHDFSLKSNALMQKAGPVLVNVQRIEALIEKYNLQTSPTDALDMMLTLFEKGDSLLLSKLVKPASHEKGN